MATIRIISASIREGKKSDRVALYFRHFISAHKLADVEILDLSTYDFPLFNERLKFQKHPLPKAIEFAEKVKSADGIIIVTPEYNGGYPAALKNVVDLLVEEWKHKPVAISSVSGGPFAGTQSIVSLQFSLWKIGAYTVPAMFPVPNVESNYSESGVATDAVASDKRALNFINELLWFVKAKTEVPH
jgi:NAD(P)H-dependent FMN reductase